ncbi:hypothetical protein COCNU_02G002310 [Cocos nucifera]|uniref:Uncharacterized protein n=1 Tax=Cocos nucifera TaxID=13894 RepID=A0A8K0HXV5_COCNU|nr:hypothetical protein COCNU_02G002310 [Cocos nucifera]
MEIKRWHSISLEGFALLEDAQHTVRRYAPLKDFATRRCGTSQEDAWYHEKDSAMGIMWP